MVKKQILKKRQATEIQPLAGQEVTIRLLGMLDDGTVVEKDPKLSFIIGEGDVNLALELCARTMLLGEIVLLSTTAQYAYGQQGRDPDIPPDASLIYQLQLLEVKDAPDVQTLSDSDCIRIGNQKRERGNYYFQREEYSQALKFYSNALKVLSSPSTDISSPEVEELKEGKVKCLNNIATTHLKLARNSDAMACSQAVLELDPDNVKALFRMGKILSEKGEDQEAMEVLKKALKLEPSTKGIVKNL
ncbi:FKBP prolyl isomerase 16 [Polypterus senegalus]|uniref:FKBP prolyl isomerase 16 n=1 Tax=Polypterus senegalus TaxID=55291 RepID=UPI001964DE4A|nr:FKBP prolyl isomerase 16 [Polypterus senegalus]